MLQSTDLETLNNKRVLRRQGDVKAIIRRENRIDIKSGLRAAGNGNRENQVRVGMGAEGKILELGNIWGAR